MYTNVIDRRRLSIYYNSRWILINLWKNDSNTRFSHLYHLTEICLNISISNGHFVIDKNINDINKHDPN